MDGRIVAAAQERSGSGWAAYCTLHELADTLSMWDVDDRRPAGQLWLAEALADARRSVAHLLEAMRAARPLISRHPAWLVAQLVDLLDAAPGLPALGQREVERRTRFAKLQGTVARVVATRADLEFAGTIEEAHEHDDDVEGWLAETPAPDFTDSSWGEDDPRRRPATADESVWGLIDSGVRPRTRNEVVDDLSEEAARAFLPEDAVAMLDRAVASLRAGNVGDAVGALEQAEELLVDEIDLLGDFRIPLAG